LLLALLEDEGLTVIENLQRVLLGRTHLSPDVGETPFEVKTASEETQVGLYLQLTSSQYLS
jgi:hypothetical protein